MEDPSGRKVGELIVYMHVAWHVYNSGRALEHMPVFLLVFTPVLCRPLLIFTVGPGC